MAITNGPRGNPDEAVRCIAKIGGPAVSARVQSVRRYRYFSQVLATIALLTIPREVDTSLDVHRWSRHLRQDHFKESSGIEG